MIEVYVDVFVINFKCILWSCNSWVVCSFNSVSFKNLVEFFRCSNWSWCYDVM